MFSSILQSLRAIHFNFAIIRAFVQLQQTLALHKGLAAMVAELERKIESHDAGIETLFDAIRRLMAPPERSRRSIGVRIGDIALPVGSRCRPVGFRVEEGALRYRVRRGA